MYCFDTDTLSAVVRRDPPLHLIRRLARTPDDQQFTTAINMGELLFGAAKRGSATLTRKIRTQILGVLPILPFDARAAEIYGPLRARLEADGQRLDEPDLCIACIALSQDLIVVTGNVRHFGRVPDLKVENWLST